tara:strand:+ start:1965 stop:2516 length:552 start_codon:yes stop_codon:yes gene_type:complete
MKAPVLVTAPASEIVTLGEAKTHLRVDHDHEDDLIGLFVTAASDYLDGWNGILGRALRVQTWRQDFGSFHDRMTLLVGPIKTVDSVTYRDEGGFEQTVDAAQYVMSGDELLIRSGYDLPTLSRDYPSPVSVTYTSGVGIVPAPIKAAVLLHMATLYENREMSASDWTPTLAYDALVAPWRGLA